MGLWNFVKRHKKKFIGSAFVFGGSYVAWKVLKPKLEEYMFKNSLKLMQRMLGELDDPEAQKAKKREKFEHIQQVSDRHTQQMLENLNARLVCCFDIPKCKEALDKAVTREDKMKALTDLQIECIARTISTLYSLHLLLLLHRVQFNIVGREMESNNKNDNMDTDASIKDVSVSYVGGDGLSHICDAVREAVKACWAKGGMQPTTKVDSEKLSSFFLNICRAADASLLEGGKGTATLLPESLDASAAPKVKQLLDEARDYVESPQFLDVFRSVADGAVSSFVNSMGDVTEADGAQTDPAKGAPLPRGSMKPLAKLGGDCVQRSQVMVAVGDGAGCIRQFGGEPLVAKLCEALYFAEEKAS